MTVGVDEVGRGCWAGPLVAGAVLLGEPIPGLKDSKKLGRRQRERLDADIRSKALAYGLGWVTPFELDKLGLSEAVKLAMKRAVAAIKEPFDVLIVDGNVNFLADDNRSRCLIRADDTVPAVSAASIIAKVARDDYMRQAARRYPGYLFENHVGYGTAAHIQALRTLGVCELHRRSFAPIKTILIASATDVRSSL
jgi:ribonuclease HII